MTLDGDDGAGNTALHLLHRAGQCADELFATNAGTASLTPRQFIVLQAIAESEEPSQTALVEKTGIDRSTMADIVRRLIGKGLAHRRRTRRDARMYAVRLTDRGQVALKSATPAARLTEDRMLRALSPAQREAFVKSLARIVATVETAEAGAQR